MRSLSGTHSGIKTYESFLLLCLFQALSPNVSYHIVFIISSVTDSMMDFVCLTVFVLYFLPSPDAESLCV